MAQRQRIRLSVQEPQGQSLRKEDPLEEEMATYTSVLAGKSHGQRSLAGLQSVGFTKNKIGRAHV